MPIYIKRVFYLIFVVPLVTTLFLFAPADTVLSQASCSTFVMVNELKSCEANSSNICVAQYYGLNQVNCNQSTCKSHIGLCTSNDCRDGLPPAPPYGCRTGPSCSTVSCGGGGGGGGGGNCNHTYSCAAQGSSVAMNKCCSGTNCCGFINSGPNKGKPKICRDNGCAPQPPVCTAPAVTSLTRASQTSMTITWSPGVGTTSQTIYVGANKTEVTNNCPGTSSPACVVKATGLAANATTYTTANVLALGTVYYAKVVNAGTCNVGSGILSQLSSCVVSPTGVQIKTGATQAITTLVNASTEISQVAYSSNNPTIASVSPSSDTTYVYGTTVTGNNQGSAVITSNVYLNGVLACSRTSSVTVVPSDPWWQVKDSDINSAGSIVSAVPTAGVNFDLDGAGGYPGVVVYGGSFDFYGGTGTGTVSSKGWLADTSVLSTKIYDSNFFESQIPADTIINNVDSSSPEGTFFESGGNINTDGYYWYKYEGATSGLDLTINSSMNLGDRKVILLVNDADLIINGNINVNDGTGFFLTVVGKNGDGGKGNLFVSPTVGGGATPNLEGIYLADGVVKTGTTEAANDIKIYFRGSVTGYDGVNLERDLGAATNATTPAEYFEYAPDQILLFPQVLSVRKINWKEVAP